MADDGLGKRAESQIRQWLNRPQDGYAFDRIPDQMTGFYGSKNICDFTCYKKPYMYYIESKATWEDRFEFSRITDHQMTGLLEKSQVDGVFSWVVVLFASYQRAIRLDIRDVATALNAGTKSINIKKISQWGIPYKELKTVPNNRKQFLDYIGEVEDLI